MGYTYDTFQTALAIEMAVPNNDPTDPQFMAILPTLIDQAEQRCYRDLDLLYLTTTHNITLVPNTNNVDISLYQPQVLILEDVWVILPAGVTNPDLAEIVPVYPASFEWVRMVYGNSAQKGPPNYYFMISDHLVGWVRSLTPRTR